MKNKIKHIYERVNAALDRRENQVYTTEQVKMLLAKVEEKTMAVLDNVTFYDVYQAIVGHRKTNPLPPEEYAETHHIKPKCLGGGEESTNKVRLTREEHLMCHGLLPFVYLEAGNKKGYRDMYQTFISMVGTKPGWVFNRKFND